MKYTKRHINSIQIDSLFTPGGTISEKQAKDIIMEKAKSKGASLSGYFK
jgi:hypothetical protein